MTGPKPLMSNKLYNGALYRKIAHRSKATINGLPNDFIILSVPVGKSTKPFIFCQKMIGNGLQCDFCIRKDQWDGDLNSLAHTCKHINRIIFSQNTPIHPNFKGLKQVINKFVAVGNISFSRIVSQDFQNVIMAAIELGQKNPNVSPETLYPKVSRKTFTEDWNKESEALFASQLDEYKNKLGSALAIDAGKLKSTPYLLVIISNIFASAPPLLVRSIRYFGGKSIDYKSVMKEVIRDLFKKGIKI